MTDDPDVYPGTNVLINKLGCKTPQELERAMRFHFILSNAKNAPPLDLSVKGISALHKHLFEPIYAWAGETRKTDIRKGNILFCRPQHIDREFKRIADGMNKDDRLIGQTKKEFVRAAAEHACELTALHPFRDGNARVIRVLLQQIAKRDNRSFALHPQDREAWTQATMQSFGDTNHEKLEELLKDRVHSLELFRLKPRTPTIDR